MRSKNIPRINLRECREKLDKPQWMVAEEIKKMFPGLRISAKHISALETNIKRQPSLDVARALTKYYSKKLNRNLDIDYLFPDPRFSK